MTDFHDRDDLAAVIDFVQDAVVSLANAISLLTG
jgi:hypothetical protein